MTPWRYAAIATAAALVLGALLWALREEPGAAPDAAPPPPDHGWIAGPAAPTYTLKLDAQGHPWLLDPKGAPLADLGLLWQADYGEPEGAAGCALDKICLHQEDAPLAWTLQGDDPGQIKLQGSYKGRFAQVEATWSAQPGAPFLHLEVRVTALGQSWPDREALSFSLPDRAAAMGRDLRFVSVQPGQRHHIGRWTPKRVIAGEQGRALHWSADGWQGLEVEAQEQSTRVTLEWEDARNHPFSTMADCSQPEGQARWLARDRQERVAGEALSRRATFQLGHTWAAWPGRAPQGHGGAVALIDTQAATTPGRLSAMLWGHSDVEEPRYGNGGVLGHQLKVTRALFSGPSGLGQRDIGELARRANSLGVRVANGSASAEADPMDLEEAGMGLMREHKASTWVDALTSCRDFHGEGWRQGQDGLPGLLARHRYRNLWSPRGLTTAPGSLNVLRPQDRGERAPWLWTWRSPELSLEVFGTVDLTGSRQRVKRRLNPTALERLSKERGVLLGRVALDQTHTEGSLSPDGLVSQESPGRYVSTPELENILFDLAHLQEEGQLWITDLESLLDRLRGLEQLQLTVGPQGRLHLHNVGATALEGLTLHLPGAQYTAQVGGQPLSGALSASQGKQAPETLIWLDLPAGASAQIELKDPQGATVQPLLPVQWTLEATPQAK